ncbi:MAG: hypothetical protein WKF71_00425 [Pyrinomonadaceae bacterium]
MEAQTGKPGVQELVDDELHDLLVAVADHLGVTEEPTPSQTRELPLTAVGLATSVFEVRISPLDDPEHALVELLNGEGDVLQSGVTSDMPIALQTLCWYMLPPDHPEHPRNYVPPTS